MSEEIQPINQVPEKKEEKYNFQITKVRVWQGLTVILAIAVVFLWMGQGSDSNAQGAVVVQPTLQPSCPTLFDPRPARAHNHGDGQ